MSLEKSHILFRKLMFGALGLDAFRGWNASTVLPHAVHFCFNHNIHAIHAVHESTDILCKFQMGVVPAQADA